MGVDADVADARGHVRRPGADGRAEQRRVERRAAARRRARSAAEQSRGRRSGTWWRTRQSRPAKRADDTATGVECGGRDIVEHEASARPVTPPPHGFSRGCDGSKIVTRAPRAPAVVLPMRRPDRRPQSLHPSVEPRAAQVYSRAVSHPLVLGLFSSSDHAAVAARGSARRRYRSTTSVRGRAVARRGGRTGACRSTRRPGVEIEDSPPAAIARRARRRDRGRGGDWSCRGSAASWRRARSPPSSAKPPGTWPAASPASLRRPASMPPLAASWQSAVRGRQRHARRARQRRAGGSGRARAPGARAPSRRGQRSLEGHACERRAPTSPRWHSSLQGAGKPVAG